MNVLVYNGPGVSQTSLAHTLSALRSLVTPYLSVRTVNASTLSGQPWSSSCALLVLPGGRDLPFVSSFATPSTQAGGRTANDAIKSYVSSGGRFLGICAGAYYSARRLEWEKGREGWEVVGDRPLGFFPGLSAGCVYSGFEYNTERGARIVRVAVQPGAEDTAKSIQVYYNGGGEFVDADKQGENVRVVARYDEDDGVRGKVAAVQCTVGSGSALLWAFHPEYPLVSEPAVSVLSRDTDHSLSGSPAGLATAESQRWTFLRTSLEALGIDIPPKSDAAPEVATALEVPKAPLPYIFATPNDTLLAQVADALTPHLSENRALLDRQSHNVIQIHTPTSSVELGATIDDRRNNPIPLPEPKPEDEAAKERDHERAKVPVDLVLCKLGDVAAGHTPLFSLKRYYEALKEAQGELAAAGHRLGDLLLYSEAVESTQTLLDKNSTLASALPPPTVALATYQLAGRGRGGNAWVSPLGQLSVSMLLRIQLSQIPAHKLAFIQYLFSVAVVDACRALLGGGSDAVRIKWPNDIYAVTARGAEGKSVYDPEVTKKLGGVLVSTSFRGSEVDIVIGCGLNVLNDRPTTSLASLAADPVAFRATTRIEDVAARVLARFDTLWAQFIFGGGNFEPFVKRYQEYWLHANQEVTLTTTTPPTRVRVVGLEPQYGLLRTAPIAAPMSSMGSPVAKEGSYIDLQPDGNSFDMFAGLIRMKV